MMFCVQWVCTFEQVKVAFDTVAAMLIAPQYFREMTLEHFRVDPYNAFEEILKCNDWECKD